MPLTLEICESIAVPPERVFAALLDVDGFRAWMPGLVRIEKLTEGPVGPGSRFREVRKLMGHEASEVFEVRSVVPGRSVELFVDGKLGSSRKGWYRFVHALEPRDGGTDLILSGGMGGMGWLGEKLGKLMMGPMKKAIAKDLRALKEHLEGR